MYKDYSQAYLDIMDDDPNTKSYEDFLPHGVSAEGMENTFKNRKDFYRRYRDLSKIGRASCRERVCQYV